jgi:hypothetical protein
MKSSLFFKVVFAALALALTTSAFAASGDSHKSNFEISAATQVNGTEIPAGDYTARWEGSGPNVQVSIMQGKKVVATAPAQVVALDRAASSTQAEIKSNSNGDRELTSLQFSGKKFSLALGTESAKGQSKSASAN